MKRILVLGDTFLDRLSKLYSKGPAKDNRNVQAHQEDYFNEWAGGAGNVACNAASMGAEQVYLGCRVGSDNKALAIEQCLKKHPGKVHECTLNSSSHATLFKHRFWTKDGYVFRYDRENVRMTLPDDYWLALNVARHDEMQCEVARHLGDENDPAVFVLVNYDKGFFDSKSTDHLTDLIARTNSVLLVDPGPATQWERFATDKTIFKINMQQAQEFIRYDHAGGTELDDRERHSTKQYIWLASSVASRMRREGMPFHTLWITLGAGGALLFSPIEQFKCFKNPPVDRVVDTCGAGDSALAAMAVTLAELPLTWEHLCTGAERGVSVGAKAVENRGTYIAQAQDMVRFG